MNPFSYFLGLAFVPSLVAYIVLRREKAIAAQVTLRKNREEKTVVTVIAY